MKIIIRFLSLILFSASLTLCSCSYYNSIHKKDIITYSDSNTYFKLKGYGHPAPFFIGGLSFYCFLELKNYFSDTEQIDGLLIFRLSDANFGFLYQNSDSEIFFLQTGNHQKEKLSSINNFNALPYKDQNLHIEMDFLDNKIRFDDVACVYLNWHSGGIYFWEYKELSDGVKAVFGKLPKDQTLVAKFCILHFTNWNDNRWSWPNIETKECN